MSTFLFWTLLCFYSEFSLYLLSEHAAAFCRERTSTQLSQTEQCEQRGGL